MREDGRLREEPEAGTGAVRPNQRVDGRRERLAVGRVEPGSLDHGPGRLAANDAAAIEEILDRALGLRIEIGLHESLRHAAEQPDTGGVAQWLDETVGVGRGPVQRVQDRHGFDAKALFHTTREPGRHARRPGVEYARGWNDDDVRSRATGKRHEYGSDRAVHADATLQNEGAVYRPVRRRGLTAERADAASKEDDRKTDDSGVARYRPSAGRGRSLRFNVNDF